LSEVRADAVPPEVRAWLASTFTRQISSHRKPGEEKPKFRSVAQAIRAGILVERIYRRMSSSSFLQFPAEVARNLKVRDPQLYLETANNGFAGSQLLLLLLLLLCGTVRRRRRRIDYYNLSLSLFSVNVYHPSRLLFFRPPLYVFIRLILNCVPPVDRRVDL
jgi:hypothetical protein